MSKIKIVGRYIGNGDTYVVEDKIFKRFIWTEADVSAETYNELIQGEKDGWFNFYEPVTKLELKQILANLSSGINKEFLLIEKRIDSLGEAEVKALSARLDNFGVNVYNDFQNLQEEVDDIKKEFSSQIDENTKYLENRIDNIVVESGDNPTQIQDSLIDVTNKNHDTLNQRLNSDTDFILGLNKNIIKLNYNSNGEVIKIEEINDNNETISTTNIEYKDGIVSKVTDKIGINTTITTFNFDNNNQLEKIIRS